MHSADETPSAPSSEEYVPVTWALRVRLLATAIITLLAVYQDWHFPAGFGNGFPAPIAAALTLVAVVLWISLANVFGRRIAWTGAGIVAILGASVIALTNLPIGNANPLRALPAPLAVAIAALLLILRFWLHRRNRDRRSPAA